MANRIRVSWAMGRGPWPISLQNFEYVLKYRSYFFRVDGARELRARVDACAWSVLMVDCLDTLGLLLELELGGRLRLAWWLGRRPSENEKGHPQQHYKFHRYV